MQKDLEMVKRRIQETAYEKFSKRGVRAVTMDDIATELRMSKKTLYKHFSGKEELVRTLVMEKYIAKHQDVFDAFDKGRTISEALTHVFPILGRYVRELSPAFLADVQNEYPEVWQLHEDKRAEMVGRFSRFLSLGVESGEVRPCVNPEVVAGIMQCVVTTYMVPDRFRDSGISLPEAFLTWFSLLSGGLFRNPPDIEEMWRAQVIEEQGARALSGQ